MQSGGLTEMRGWLSEGAMWAKGWSECCKNESTVITATTATATVPIPCFGPLTLPLPPATPPAPPLPWTGFC